MNDFRRRHETEGQVRGGKGGGARMKNTQQMRREFSHKVKESLESIHAAEMEALKANQELAFDTERRALQATAESDKAAALAFANDSWQARLEQETGKLQQLQKKTRDDMEAFYQNELKVQLDKQRVRMEEFYDKQNNEEEDKRQKDRAGEAAGGGVGAEGVQRVLEKLGERVAGKAAGPMGRLRQVRMFYCSVGFLHCPFLSFRV